MCWCSVEYWFIKMLICFGQLLLTGTELKKKKLFSRSIAAHQVLGGMLICSSTEITSDTAAATEVTAWLGFNNRSSVKVNLSSAQVKKSAMKGNSSDSPSLKLKALNTDSLVRASIPVSLPWSSHSHTCASDFFFLQIFGMCDILRFFGIYGSFLITLLIPQACQNVPVDL